MKLPFCSYAVSGLYAQRASERITYCSANETLVPKTILKRTSVAAAILGSLTLLTLSGCSKDSKPDSFWTQRASSQEQITPAFIDSARHFLGAIRNERNSLNAQDQDFRNAESAVWKLRDDAGRQIKTHADRDIYWRLTSYAEKVALIRSLAKDKAGGSAFLTALRAQVDACGDELDKAFNAQPIRRLEPLPLADEPCTTPVRKSTPTN
jgi:hypothetical protein